MVLVRIVLLPARLAFKTTGFAVKLGYRTGRLFGYRRLFVFAAGVGVGLLIAPMPGRALRAKLSELLTGTPPEPLPAPVAPDEVDVADLVTGPAVAAADAVAGTAEAAGSGGVDDAVTISAKPGTNGTA